MRLFDSIISAIEMNDYSLARLETMIEVSLLKPKLIDPQRLLKNRVAEKLSDLINNSYKDSKYDIDYSESDSKPITEFREYDKKVIKQIELLELEALNLERWNFDERLKNNLIELAQYSKTFDIKYITQLSYLLQAVEDNYSPVLILGETGVGKTMLAKKVHQLGKLPEDKYVYLDCASLDASSIYPNLFGAKKGSFTGAYYDLPGKLKQANGGTLFIDEIDKAPKDIRLRLLTFIDTKIYEPLGKKPEKADVYLIIGMNQNPRTLVEKGLLEEDFYYRIAGRIIEIPPLRERPNDIITIAKETIREYVKGDDSTYFLMNNEAEILLESYMWPGNYRQLRNYILFQISKSKWEGNGEITGEQIKEDPPLNKKIQTDFDFRDFEAMILKYLSKWDQKKGKFTKEFILPILAKLYIEDIHIGKNQTEKNEMAMSIVDMDGNSNRGSLRKNYLKYKKIESEFCSAVNQEYSVDKKTKISLKQTLST